jgi:hypothetical protein
MQPHVHLGADTLAVQFDHPLSGRCERLGRIVAFKNGIPHTFGQAKTKVTGMIPLSSVAMSAYTDLVRLISASVNLATKKAVISFLAGAATCEPQVSGPAGSAFVNLATERAKLGLTCQHDSAAVIAAIEKAGYATRRETLELQIEGMTCASCGPAGYRQSFRLSSAWLPTGIILPMLGGSRRKVEAHLSVRPPGRLLTLPPWETPSLPPSSK